MKLLDELNNARDKYNRLNSQYKKVITSIKEELSGRYYANYEDKFRHSICLYYGEFVKQYAWRHLPNNLKLSQSRHWDSDLKCQMSDNYYDIYKIYGSIINETSEHVGFACELKYLPEALQHKLEKLWLYHVKENRYRDGLITFKAQVESNDIDLFKLFKQYHSNSDNVVTIMHHPSLKIKNVVLFIESIY